MIENVFKVITIVCLTTALILQISMYMDSLK